MQNYLSPEQFSAVWSRVAPEGSGGIVPKASTQPSSLECADDTLNRCAFLIRQLEGEDFLYRFLRCHRSPESRSFLSDTDNRIHGLSLQFSNITSHHYRLHHLLQLSWADRSPRDVAQLSRDLETEYRRFGMSTRDVRMRDTCFAYAQQHQELQHMLIG